MSLLEPERTDAPGVFPDHLALLEIGISLCEARCAEEASDRLKIALVCKRCPACFMQMIASSSQPVARAGM